MKKIYLIFENLRRLMFQRKEWWLTPALLIFTAVILIILYLMKYKNTEFIYSLF